jgi:hypothetical protein
VYLAPRIRRVALFATLPFLFLAISALLANSTTAPPAAKVAGAPGNGSCAECHTGAVTNPGRVLIDFGKLTYSPGVKQKIGVHVLANTAAALTGFQLTARLGSNEQLQAGHFEATGTVGVQNSNGIEYVNHTGATGSMVYTFDWTPPATNVGPVQFYVSAVAGSAAAGPEGNVYSNSSTLQAAGRDLPAGYSVSSFIPAGTNTLVEPNGINSVGDVTGRYTDVNNRSHGFIRRPSGQTTTIDVANALDTIPSAINSAQRVVGSWVDTNNVTHGFIRDQNGTPVSYDVPGATKTELLDINDAGVIVGRFTDGAGVVQSLTIAANGTTSFRNDFLATGINLPGEQIGQINNSAFLLNTANALIGTSMCEALPLRSITFNLRMNSFRDIAGICSGQNQFASFIVAEGGRARRSTNIGDTFRAINDAGQVAGQRTVGGVTQGVIYTPCTTSPSQDTYSIPGTAGSGSLTLSNASNCVPNAISDVPWFRFGGPDPQNASYSYFADGNPTGTPRTGTVWFAGRNVTIRQEPATCNVVLSGGPANFQAAGGSGTLSVTGPDGCVWTASTNAGWITLATFSGTVPGTLNFTVQPNPDFNLRTGTITVGTTAYNIVQTGGSTCIYTVDPPSTTVSSFGGLIFINVFTGTGCFWGVSNNESWITVSSISQAFGSGTVTLSVQQNFNFDFRSASIVVAGQLVSIIQQGTGNTGPSTGLRFVPITPCRVADTRAGSGIGGAFGPPRLTANSTREFPISQSSCGIPTNARAYAANITVVPSGPLSFLTAYPSGTTRPLASTLNAFDGRTIANAAIVPAGTNGGINIFVSNDTDVIIDVNGYFIPVDTQQGLMFYPVTPCRISDSRPEGGKTGSFGPPSITGQTARSIPVTQSTCNIPASAQAYSLNVTAVPQGPLGFLTLYPTGQVRPNVSTLNAFNGQVVANAAIVRAGNNGAIDVFASDTTNVVIDINGYFAPPGFSNALNFYTVNPCRVADTRDEGGKSGAFGPPIIGGGATRSFPIPQSGCNVPVSAQAFSLNMTAVPAGPLAFLTTWPSGFTQPLVSTLNSFDGQIVANAALVPAGTNGGVSVFVSNTSNLVVDVNGYFAP